MPVLLIGIHMTLVRMRGQDFVVVSLVISYFAYLWHLLISDIEFLGQGAQADLSFG